MIKIILRLALLMGAVLHAATGAWFNDSCVLAKFVETGKAFNTKDAPKTYPMDLGSGLDTAQSKIVLTDTKTSSNLKRAYRLDSANKFEEELRFNCPDPKAKRKLTTNGVYSVSIVKTASDSFNIDSLKTLLARVEKLEETSLWRTKNNVYFQLSLAKPACDIQASIRISRRLGVQTGYLMSCTFRDSAFIEKVNPCIPSGLEQGKKTKKRDLPTKLSKSKNH
ncbi:MAG: hypothetical protein RL173_2490 [Fibrobacterota bacterium]|jgi:hypothetical protein